MRWHARVAPRRGLRRGRGPGVRWHAMAWPVLPVGPFYVKDCVLHGFAMFNYSAKEQRQCGEDINRWLAEGKLKANVDRVLPLSEAAEAHRLQEENTIHLAGTLAGKIVLKT